MKDHEMVEAMNAWKPQRRGISTLKRLVLQQLESAKVEHQRLLTLVDQQVARVDELQKLLETLEQHGKE